MQLDYKKVLADFDNRCAVNNNKKERAAVGLPERHATASSSAVVSSSERGPFDSAVPEQVAQQEAPIRVAETTQLH